MPFRYKISLKLFGVYVRSLPGVAGQAAGLLGGQAHGPWAYGRQALLVFINQTSLDMIVDRYQSRIDTYFLPLPAGLINEARCVFVENHSIWMRSRFVIVCIMQDVGQF